MIRGDHDANEIKLKRLLGVTDLELAGPATVEKVTGAPVGFAGPVGLNIFALSPIMPSRRAQTSSSAGTTLDTHLVDVNWPRDFHVEQFADLRNARAGDPSPRKDGVLKTTKGIEVGHVFMLGTKYSQAMNASFLDPKGRNVWPSWAATGSASAGRRLRRSSRTMMTKASYGHFPSRRFMCISSLSANPPAVTRCGHQLYAALQAAGLEVLWDDRDERAGVKFNDADLIGAPYQVIVGDKGLAEGVRGSQIPQHRRENQTRSNRRPAGHSRHGFFGTISLLIPHHSFCAVSALKRVHRESSFSLPSRSVGLD